MMDEGTVSLWLGKASNEECVQWSLLVEFSEDGDFLGSPFSQGFRIEYYEDSTREFEFFDRELTRGHLITR